MRNRLLPLATFAAGVVFALVTLTRCSTTSAKADEPTILTGKCDHSITTNVDQFFAVVDAPDLANGANVETVQLCGLGAANAQYPAEAAVADPEKHEQKPAGWWPATSSVQCAPAPTWWTLPTSKIVVSCLRSDTGYDPSKVTVRVSLR